MKKQHSIILINIVLFSALFIVFDYISAKADYDKNIRHYKEVISSHKDYEKFMDVYPDVLPFKYNLSLYHISEKLDLHDDSLRRKAVPDDTHKSQKGSVIVFGGSFAEGALLADTETFEYQLMQASNRTVFNRGYSGFGPAPMLWMLRNDEFYKTIDTEPDYIVYIYIMDHIRRIYADKFSANDMRIYIGFTPHGNKLVEKYPFSLQLFRFSIFREIFTKFLYPEYMKKENADRNFNMLKLIFEESKREAQKHWPNVKFVILKHPVFYKENTECIEDDACYTFLYSYTSPRWKELENEGFIIFDLKEKFNEDFESPDYTVPDKHPNFEAWKKAVPEFIRELKM